jgi:hypothetical protein
VDIISRYGENTFAILLPETKLLHARFVAERLRLSVLEKDFAEKDTDVLKITARPGCWSAIKQGVRCRLIARVSAALESSQAENGNRVALASDFNGRGQGIRARIAKLLSLRSNDTDNTGDKSMLIPGACAFRLPKPNDNQL